MPDSFLPPHAPTLTVGALSGPVVVPVPDLEKLRFLSEIKSADELHSLSDGPYLVGRVVDRGAFNAPVIHPNMICSTSANPGYGGLHVVAGKKICDYDNDSIFLSGGWDPQSDVEFPNPAHRRLIADVLRIDAMLGFRRTTAELSYDQRSSLPGGAQRTPVWHRDGGSPLARSYLVSSAHGTVFLREAVSRAGGWAQQYTFKNDNLRHAWRHNAHDMEQAAQANQMLVESAPYDIYLMRPQYTWHRGQIMPHGGPRTFLRMVCGCDATTGFTYR